MASKYNWFNNLRPIKFSRIKDKRRLWIFECCCGKVLELDKIDVVQERIKNCVINLLVDYEIEVKKTNLPIHLSFTTRKAKNSFRYQLPHNSNKFFPKIIDPYFTIKQRSKKRKKQDLKEAILWKLKEIKTNPIYDIWYPPAGWAKGKINAKTIIRPINFVSVDMVLTPGFLDAKVEIKEKYNE